MVAHPDRGAGNDPEPFFFFFFFRGVGSLSQPRLNIFTVGNMRVMICLGQGGLRSLSASSFIFNHAIVVSVDCGAPPEMLNAAEPEYEGTLLGNITTYSCMDSYEFRSGNSKVSIECQPNNTWEEFPESCVGE